MARQESLGKRFVELSKEMGAFRAEERAGNAMLPPRIDKLGERLARCERFTLEAEARHVEQQRGQAGQEPPVVVVSSAKCQHCGQELTPGGRHDCPYRAHQERHPG